MGNISPDKKLYDDLAVEYFERDGWIARAVEKAGRYSDVLASKGSRLAIVEVKSPRETSASRSWDDAKQLSAHLEEEIGNYLKRTREKVFDLFPERGKGIQRLYAAAIACQLHRYLHEFEELRAKYHEVVADSIDLAGKRYLKSPYLVVPSEYSAHADEALRALKGNRYIARHGAKQAGRLYVIAFEF